MSSLAAVSIGWVWALAAGSMVLGAVAGGAPLWWWYRRLGGRHRELSSALQSAVAASQQATEQLEELRTQMGVRLATLEGLADELDHRRQYVESLQRELLYRDERLLALPEAGSPLPGVLSQVGPPPLPIAPAGGSAGQGRHGRSEEPGLEEIVEPSSTQP